MRYVTWMTHRTPNAERCLSSFRLLGIEPDVIGLGDRFTWRDRMAALRAYALDHPDDLILHFDGWDCALLREPVAFDPGDTVLFSSEANCWPDKRLANRYPEVAHAYRYLNAGVWLARGSVYADVCRKPWPREDQLYWSKKYLDDDGASLDVEQVLAHSLYDRESDWEMDDEGYRVCSTGARPWIAHGNGKADIAAVWDALGV